MLYNYSSVMQSEIWYGSFSRIVFFFSQEDFGYLESFVVPYEFENVFFQVVWFEVVSFRHNRGAVPRIFQHYSYLNKTYIMTTPADMPTCVGKFHKVLPLDEKLQAIPSKGRGGHGKSWHRGRGRNENIIVIYEILKNKNIKIYNLHPHMSCIVLERVKSSFSTCFPFFRACFPVKPNTAVWFPLRNQVEANVRKGRLNDGTRFSTPFSYQVLGSMNSKDGNAKSLKHQKASLFRGHRPRKSAQS